MFSWPLSNWKKLDRKMTSPEFMCGGHKWRVDRLVSQRSSDLTYPSGEYFFFPLAMPARRQMIPCRYIWTTYPPRIPTPGTPVPSSRSFFRMRLILQTLSSAVSTRLPFCPRRVSANARPLHIDAHHRFVPEECDWGFTRFYDLRKLFQAPDPTRHPIIENESAIVTVFVRVLKDPTGVLWHNFVK